MSKNRIIFACLLTLVSLNAQAQDKSNIEHVIESKSFGKERVVKVYLPDQYLQDATSKYIVTYVLDAQSNEFWDMAKSNIGYLISQYAVIPMIVVGIVSDNRNKEFSPPAAQLQQHLRDEVFPLIEQEYRVRNFRTIIGHSRGGAFVAGTLFSDNNDLFDGYIGISPSFSDQGELIIENATTMLNANKVSKKYLYLSHGDIGSAEHKYAANVATIDSLIKEYPSESLAWKTKLFAGTDHWQVVIPSFNDGLVSMTRNYFADQKVIQDFAKVPNSDLKKKIEEYYLRNESLFGFAHKTSPGYLNYIAEDFRDSEDYRNAIVLFKMALEEKPDDLRIHLGLADTYDKMKENSSAREAFRKSLELLERQKDTVDENYYVNVSTWLNEKLSQEE